MLDRRIRAERARKKISQDALARAAGVPRSQLSILEQGGNVTLSTLNKIVSALGGLRLELIPDTLDVEEALRTAAEMEELAAALQATAARLGRTLSGAPAPSPARAPAGTPPGAAFDDDLSDVDPAQMERLEDIVRDILRQRQQRAPD